MLALTAAPSRAALTPAPHAPAPDDRTLPEVAAGRAAQRRTAAGLRTGAWLLALSSAGVLLVALGYAAGRLGYPGGSAAYWIGQLLVFVPVAARLLSRRLSGTAEALLLVLGLAANQYLLKWAYSPDQLRFPDELQHWAATRTLVRTGLLFRTNTALPVSVHFPALEEMGAAVASMTGLSVASAGMLLSGVLHLAFVATLFMLVARTSSSARVAAVSCLVYATGLHYLFFDSMYGYQTAALPFLLLAVWAARAVRPLGWRAGVIGLVAIFATVASHHVTSLVLVATLVAFAAVEIVLRDRQRATSLAFAGAAVLTVACWFGLVAHEVIGYLALPLHGMLTAVDKLVNGGETGTAAAGGNGSPLWSLAVQGASLIALLGLFAVAATRQWRTCRTAGRRPSAGGRARDPWRWSLLLGALLFFAASAVRFLGAQGPELAGRAATFTYLPMSIVAAGVLVGRGHRSLPARLPRLPRLVRALPASLVLLVMLTVSARLGGWPPVWEQLPGQYQVSGYESGVDPLGVAAAVWTHNELGAGNRFAADANGYTLVSTYGGQDPVGEAAALYDDAQWGLSDELVLQKYAVGFLWVDARIATQAPASGTLFPVDPRTGQRTTPLPAERLSKLDLLTGADRIYDNGTIRLYDMRNV